jgi:murein DD-endopeptidase MepM/ murein hydrolase activator NlpD
MEKESRKQKFKKVFNKKRLTGFLDKFGFYLILLVCLMIIGVTAFFTRGGRGNQPIVGEDQNSPSIQTEGETLENSTDDDIDIIVTDIINGDEEDSQGSPEGQSDSDENLEAVSEDNSNLPANDDKDAESDNDDKDAEADLESSTKGDVETAEEEDIPASAPGQADLSLEMAVPVNGQVMRPYSADELLYSPTLKEWTTHTGIDIEGPMGGEVRAVLDGVVESIKEDPLMGIVITLAHENDLKTVYMGLSTKDMVREGQQIQKGQVISGIGRTAAFEILDDPHLHFEVLLNGEHQDPSDYIIIEQEK